MPVRSLTVHRAECADVRLQAGYAAVLLLAFWQLCISAVAASDNRTTTERRVFLIGELLVTIVLPPSAVSF